MNDNNLNQNHKRFFSPTYRSKLVEETLSGKFSILLPGRNNLYVNSGILESEIQSKLLGPINAQDESLYGDKYKDHLLEQYKIYVDMTYRISGKRESMNTFFLTINTGIISAIGIAGFFEKDKMVINKEYIIFLTITLIFFCYIWYRLIRTSRVLNTAKFKVIHEIEKKLPLKPFDSEWEALSGGLNKEVYLPFSDIEKFIPLIFAGLQLSLLIYILLSK